MLAPFHAPTCKAANATVSIIQPQFSCSWATCYGSVVTGPIATGCLICLMGLLGVLRSNGLMSNHCGLTNVGLHVSRLKAVKSFVNRFKSVFKIELCIILREKAITPNR